MRTTPGGPGPTPPTTAGAEALDGLRELQRAIGACFAGADRAVLDGGLATARAAFALAPAWTALALVLALAIDDSHRAAPRRAARTPADRHPGTTTN
ncbi:hypothetical protein [Streptomyces lydicamycinicus]|uniref:hypothetical protein n=1 Tax=Streptomyces lydicamycinicus TaxID=1546107 RepID=UPI003C2BA6D3